MGYCGIWGKNEKGPYFWFNEIMRILESLAVLLAVRMKTTEKNQENVISFTARDLLWINTEYKYFKDIGII